jgi:polar amino acid transport system substrate-binding protein
MRRPLPLIVAITATAALAWACTTPSGTAGPTGAAQPSAVAGGLLDKILTAGKIVVSTDPAYPPQSQLNAEGNYEGFDIDTANEIARRLGVAIEYTTPDWTAITAGGWGGRWDISVGSMAITPERAQVIDFSDPYYYTPAQMAASTESGITTIDALIGKTVCVGESTTYLYWFDGTLDFGPAGKPEPPPQGIQSVTLPTDKDCALTWQAGRHDFEGWLSSITTVEAAIAEGLPLVKVEEPVFNEPLAVATDKSGPPTADFIAWLNETIAAMHADGTLSGFSQEWFGADFTKG